MSTIRDTFSDFFSKSVDGTTGHADCLYCDRNSSEEKGKWGEYCSTWVCDEHIQTQIDEEKKRRQEKRAHLLRTFGEGGRGYLVFYQEPGKTVEEQGETFVVARKSYSPGGPNPNTENNDPTGWYVKIK